MNKEIYKDIGVIKNKWIETKNDYLDMSLNIISDLQQENKELHNKINKLEDKIKQMDNRFKNGLCIDNYLGGRKTRKLFEEMYEILKDSDVDE